MRKAAYEIMRICYWPSQAFWRYLEYRVLKELTYEGPILEIGCGTGRFSTLIFNSIDVGIDINPRAIGRCRREAGILYKSLRCLDVHELHMKPEAYGTIFANCVMEHIPDLQCVLVRCCQGLKQGGRLVITVPLEAMNRHLALKAGWYVACRQKQLCHINLFSEAGWRELLNKAGFGHIESIPYLFEEDCRLWDQYDTLACLGFGRYRLSVAVQSLAKLLLSRAMKERILWNFADRIVRWSDGGLDGAEACATALIAWKT